MSDVVTNHNLQYFGTITEKSAPSSSKMKFSGFVSTTDPDLSGDIVEQGAYDKHIAMYKKNPVYLYQHDKLQPIGKVSNVITNFVKDGKTGLYLEDVVLSDIPVVRDVIFPLIQDDVLTQQSVGMFSIKGEIRENLYVHTEVYLYECSLVTVAANPNASIDTFKGLEDYQTIQQLMKAYDEGKIPLKRNFFMSTPTKAIKEETPMNIINGHPTTLDFADAEVLKANMSGYDPEGEAVAMPTKVEKNFVTTCENTHVCKSTSRGSYMFQIGQPTEKGFKYDWDLVATAMCRVLGANGGAHFEKGAKVAIIERIADAYRTLEKEVPTVSFEDGSVVVTIDKVSSDALGDVEYKNVTFKNEENEIYKQVMFVNDAKRLGDTLKSWGKAETGVPEKAKEILKWIYTSVDIDIEGNPDDETDVAFFQTLLALIAKYRNRNNTEYMLGLSETDRVVVKELIEKLEKEIATVIEPAVEKTPEEIDATLEELTKSLAKVGIVVVEKN